MKRRQISVLVCCLLLPFLGCDKANYDTQVVEPKEPTSGLNQARRGATQIDGIGYFADIADCDYTAEGADFALHLTGDLEGCLYVYVDEYECSPSGTYRESGMEKFVGTYMGEAGSFQTNYKFEGKFEGCNEDGSYAGAEILGRCQHPIVKGSGDGVFEGVSGRLDLKDDIEAGNFPYRGHLRY